jgi:hypothetical protein
MKQIKLCNLWTLDVEIDGKMIQVFSSKYKRLCKAEQIFYSLYSNKTIQKRKVLTDKY